MRIQVTSKSDLVNEKTGKGGYFHFTLKYSKDGKEFNRKLVSFGGSLPSYNVLKDSVVGDQYDVELKKDDTGNWQWTDAVKADQSTPAAATSGGTMKSTYETPEERAYKQKVIIRQSCLANAISVKGIGEENADNLTELAEKFEAWVTR